MTQRFARLRVGLLASAIGAVLGTSAGNSALAQESQGVDRLEEITITGTRIRRQDYVSPNPVQTIDSEYFANLGIVNVGDALTEIPANVSQFQPANTGGSAFFIGSTLANLRGLNPFFGTRTLTLVDGRRFIPTTQGDSVDLNFIPSNLIQRMEVVTGGASAAYGSGAISGVVNVLLDKNLEGLRIDLDRGGSTRGDGEDTHVGIGFGTALFGGRGHLIVGGEYQNQDVIQSCADARDWCAEGRGMFNNNLGFSFSAGDPVTPKIPGQPHNIIVSNLRQNQLSHTGVIFNNTPGATSTLQFTPDGNGVVPFAIGAEGWRTTGGTVVGGDGEPTYRNLSLFPEVERHTAYAHLSYDFSDSLSGFVEASYGAVEGVNRQWAPGQNTAYACIRPDNAYLAAASPNVQAAIAASPNNAVFSTFPNQFCGDFTGGFLPFLDATAITKDWSEQVDQRVTTDTEVTRIVLGLSGDLGARWSWDAYYQYGKTKRDQIGTGYRTNWRYDMALDAIIDPRPDSPTFGQPVCRVGVTGIAGFPAVDTSVIDPSLTQGCQPLNPFGYNASPEALAFAFGALTEQNDIRQDVIAATVSGELWRGFAAGPLVAAFGAEYRAEDLTNDAGGLPRPQRTDFGLQYGDSFAGETTVSEAFVEFEMPFLANRPGAELLMLNYSYRHAKYENEGHEGPSAGQSGTQRIDSWKFSGVWDPVEWLRIRGSRSRDLRAASFRELYYSQNIPPGGFFGSTNNPWLPPDPTNPQAQSDATWLILQGNPLLRPEEADTTTYGFVISPGSGRMNFSADYYEIELKDGLQLGSAAEVVRQCFEEGNQAQCARIVFGPPAANYPDNPQSNIEELYSPYLNAAPYSTRGIDFAWDYSLPLAGNAGSMAFRLTATRALETLVQSGQQTRDVAGQTGGDQGFLSDFASSPDWAANVVVSYFRDRLALTLQGRYVASGVLDKQTPKTGPGEPGYDPLLTGSVTDNTVPSYFLTSFTGSYDFPMGDNNLQLFLSVNNLFDRDPPFAAGAVGGTNAVFFDALGRTYRAGVRMRF